MRWSRCAVPRRGCRGLQRGYPPVVNLRPAADWPSTSGVGVNLTRMRAVIDCVVADLDDVTRAPGLRPGPCGSASGPSAEPRRRLSELAACPE
ncbi:MAG TPA: hypothetical protein VKI99_01810 [Candidatus Dormibacteraeota bacterium]|nr:hypothetical protein [Candidatus Dormibacteraeota bacterium]